MRWTLMALQTSALEADLEVVWSWRPDAGLMLAESIPPMTVAKEPGHRGARNKVLKPLRRECRVFPL
jgi:hypothetical protein